MEEDPFPGLQMMDPGVLDSLPGRTVCPKCGKSRKYFCYSCYLPVAGLEDKLPRVQLPLKIDIIKHPNEVEGKSTSSHAVVLAPDDVNIFTFPCIPDYDPKQDVLVFPDEEAMSLEDYLRQRDAASGEANGTLSTPPPESTQSENSCAAATKPGEDGDSLQKGDSGPTGEEPSGLPVGERADMVSTPDANVGAAGDAEKTRNGADAKGCGDEETTAEADGATKAAEASVSKTSSSAETDSVANLPEEEEKSGVRKRKLEGSGEGGDKERGEAVVPQKAGKTVLNARIPRVVFVDSTWNQTKRIVGDERLRGLQKLELRTRTTKFWRSQQGLPMTCLSTIEAIYYFLRDYHALCCPQPYCGQYDNLLLFFVSTYHKIRRASNGANIKAYNR